MQIRTDTDEVWRFDAGLAELTCGDRRVSLTPKERAMVAILAGAAGRCVRYGSLIQQLWPQDELDDPMDGIKVLACRVRRKLADAGLPPALGTCWGLGLLWRPSTECVAPVALVPAGHVAALRLLLATHHDRPRAEALHYAVFGV